jgi:DNA-binding transcriptional LysR family regulator
MKNATLRQLKVFETVARLLSFTRAAEELHLTQPAVSTQVKELERHAGSPLFDHLGRKIYLTQAGTQLLHHGRAIIQSFRDAEEAMQQMKGVSGGRLDVAVVSAGDYFVPRLMAEFSQRHSGVVLNLTVHSRAELLQQLSENLTDLAVTARPPVDLDTVNEAFAPHPYVIIAPSGHPLSRKKRISMATLVREPFLLRERGSDTRHAMAQAFGPWIDKVTVAMELKRTETIKQAVMAGMGLAFLSAHTVTLERQLGSLTVLDVQGFPLMLDWYVVHRRKRLPPVAAAFKSFLLTEGASVLESIDHFGMPARRRLAGKKRARSATKQPVGRKPT